MSTKRIVTQLSAAIVLCAMQILATAETSGGGTPPPKQVCKTFDIPVIICPPGETLATPKNGCHAGFEQKTFCRDAARQGAIRPYGAGTKELVTRP